MSESRACAHPGCAGSARKGSDYCCNAHKQAAYRKRNKQPVTEPSVTADPVTEELGGTIGPTDGRSSSTGDPRDTESGECVDLSDPLPGDPGYQGMCVQLQGGTVQTDGKWVLDPSRKRLTLPEMQKRHAHG